MDEISQLIREAKPLYKARKRRNNILKSGLAVLVCVISFSWFYEGQDQRAEWDYSIYFYGSEYSVSENTSIIEEMGLPTDDYGLLVVG